MHLGRRAIQRWRWRWLHSTIIVFLLCFAPRPSCAFSAAPMFQLGSLSWSEYISNLEKKEDTTSNTPWMRGGPQSSTLETEQGTASNLGRVNGATTTPSLTTVKEEDPYAITPHTLELCSTLFPKYAKNDGYVHGWEAHDLFSMSGVDRQSLNRIWHLADGSCGPADEKLNEEEFVVAVHLIVCVTMKGLVVPNVLPSSLTGLGFNGDTGEVYYKSSSETKTQPPQYPQSSRPQTKQATPASQSSETHQQPRQPPKPAASQAIPMDTPARQSLPDHLCLKSMPGKGLGVITTEPITKGAVVGDYKGEVMTEEEKDRRYLESLSHLQTPDDHEWRQSRLDRGQTITGSYLYGIPIPNARHGIGKPDGHIYVDAEDEYTGSLWTRFINHASDPDEINLTPQSLHVGWDGNPRVWFTAKRDIDAGEELCFDYGKDYWLPGDTVV